MYDHETAAFLVRYFDLLTDPAHWAFELTVQLFVDGLIVGGIWRFAVRGWIRGIIDREHEVHGMDRHD